MSVSGLSNTKDKTDSNIDSTIHYLSPASLTVTSLQSEEDRKFGSFPDYLFQYIQPPSGEYVSYFTEPSSVTIEIPQLERTCAIIKPDAVYFEDVIMRKIFEAGFKVLQKRYIHLTPEQASEFYAQHYGSLSFPYLVVSLSAGPIIVMCLSRNDAINKWKEIIKETGSIGYSWFFPKSMKLRFGCLAAIDNVLHGSENFINATREIRYFFPQSILEPIMRAEAEVTDFLTTNVNPTLIDALTELCKKKPIEPLIFFSEWLLLNNPYQPKMKPEIAKLPT